MPIIFHHWHIRLLLIKGTLIALFSGRAGELPMHFPSLFPHPARRAGIKYGMY